MDEDRPEVALLDATGKRRIGLELLKEDARAMITICGTGETEDIALVSDVGPDKQSYSMVVLRNARGSGELSLLVDGLGTSRVNLGNGDHNPMSLMVRRARWPSLHMKRSDDSASVFLQVPGKESEPEAWVKSSKDDFLWKIP